MRSGKKSVANLIFAYQCHEIVWRIWFEDDIMELESEKENERWKLASYEGRKEKEGNDFRKTKENTHGEERRLGISEAKEKEKEKEEEEDIFKFDSELLHTSYLQWLPFEMIAETLELVTFRQDI